MTSEMAIVINAEVASQMSWKLDESKTHSDFTSTWLNYNWENPPRISKLSKHAWKTIKCKN